jgi:hypothetical protein
MSLLTNPDMRTTSGLSVYPSGTIDESIHCGYICEVNTSWERILRVLAAITFGIAIGVA